MALHLAAAIVPGVVVLGGLYGGYKIARYLRSPKGSGKAAAKAAASDALRAASKTTPHPTLGLDPGMTAADVSRVNHALQQGTDSGGLFALAGDLLNQGHATSAQAVAAKAQAVDAAKVSGLSDDDIFHAMMTAGTTPVTTVGPITPNNVGPAVTYAPDPSMDLAMNLADASRTFAHAQGLAATMGGPEVVGAFHMTPWG